MMQGKFSKEDVLNSIKSISNSLLAALDNASDICDNYFFHNTLSSPLFSERIKNLNKVKKEDIVNLSKKLKLITIYMMKGDNHERN